MTRVGLFRGGRGGVLSPVIGVLGSAELVVTVTPAGATLTVATLALDPIESLLDAKLSLEGEDVPLRVLCTVGMLSVEADIPLTPTLPPFILLSSTLIRLESFARPEGEDLEEADVARPRRSPFTRQNELTCRFPILNSIKFQSYLGRGFRQRCKGWWCA